MTYNTNPLQMLNMIKGGMDPQQMMLALMQQGMGNTPMGANLVNMAKNNDAAGIEQFARNLCASQGKDFDTEFASFKQMLGIK